MLPSGTGLYLLLGILAAVVAVALYFAFAPWPRRRRAFRRARRLLDAGKWEEALVAVDLLQPDRQGATWKARLYQLAGESHQRGADQALKELRFEDALGHATQAATLSKLDEAVQRERVIEAALAEVRRLFAVGDDACVRAMIERTTRLAGATPPEATFWSALCELREGHLEQAAVTMQAVCEQAGKVAIDPPFYLGMILHRLGRPQEALRYLADANRLDGNSPFVLWQMGVSLVASGGDSGLAMRALQKALGGRGLGQWQNQPDHAWDEGFPEGRSYVRRLASRHRYVCPLLGSDLKILMRQGQLALAQAFYRQERFGEAADLYGKLLQDNPPTVMLLRGYGLSLARLGQHDQAYKHLRSALEQEEPKDPFTAGYLALCGALGKPTNAEDKPKNVNWGLRLLARYPVMGNAEWAGLIAGVQAEARKVGVPLSVDDQLLLCDTLASVQAIDPRAAVSYTHLANTFPDALKPVHAWLYAKSAVQHGVSGPCDLDLFARVFQDPAAARAFYEQHGWDLTDAEYTYLERSARQAPGRFPEVFGPDYPARGEAFLLDRSRQQEEAGKKDPARTSVEVLLRLAPSSLAGHDRLACLHYRAGDRDRAVELLGGWHQLAPADHWPLVRQAVIEQERGNAGGRAAAIQAALERTHGPLRAAVAFLGARLTLRETAQLWAEQKKDTPPEVSDDGKGALDETKRLLQECLRDAPEHADALWCLAAVHAVLGDSAGLAGQAAVMDRPAVTDARFHLLGAACHLAARQFDQAAELGKRTEADAALATEGRFVTACAHLQRGDEAAARELLRKVAGADKSSAAPYARALLGHLAYQKGAADEAITWWTGVPPAFRARWSLDEPLRQSTLLAGLELLGKQRFEQAADRFREAGRLGLREKRLGGLITLALVKAGQRLLYEQDGR